MRFSQEKKERKKKNTHAPCHLISAARRDENEWIFSIQSVSARALCACRMQKKKQHIDYALKHLDLAFLNLLSL